MLLFEGLFIALIIMTIYALIEDHRNAKTRKKPMATWKEWR